MTRPTGFADGSLAGFATDYIGACRNRFNPATIAARKRELAALVEWLGADTRIRDVTSSTAAVYVTPVLSRNGNTRKTNEDKIGHLSAVWAYAIGQGAYGGTNPWAGQAARVDVLPDDARDTPARRPWTNDELRSVFSRRSGRRNVWLAGVVGLYTGARLGELCHVRRWQVDLRSRTIWIYDAKTQLPVRRIPIHPVVYPLIARQLEDPSDDYLIHGEAAAGRDRNRARYLSRRFTNWLREDHGIRDRGVVFQSLRNTFVEAAHRAGIPGPLVRALLTQGSGVPTRRHFASVNTHKVLSDAVSRITFEETDDIVRSVSQRSLVAGDRRSPPPRHVFSQASAEQQG